MAAAARAVAAGAAASAAAAVAAAPMPTVQRARVAAARVAAVRMRTAAQPVMTLLDTRCRGFGYFLSDEDDQFATCLAHNCDFTGPDPCNPQTFPPFPGFPFGFDVCGGADVPIVPVGEACNFCAAWPCVRDCRARHSHLQSAQHDFGSSPVAEAMNMIQQAPTSFPSRRGIFTLFRLRN